MGQRTIADAHFGKDIDKVCQSIQLRSLCGRCVSWFFIKIEKLHLDEQSQGHLRSHDRRQTALLLQDRYGVSRLRLVLCKK